MLAMQRQKQHSTISLKQDKKPLLYKCVPKSSYVCIPLWHGIASEQGIAIAEETKQLFQHASAPIQILKHKPWPGTHICHEETNLSHANYLWGSGKERSLKGHINIDKRNIVQRDQKERAHYHFNQEKYSHKSLLCPDRKGFLNLLASKIHMVKISEQSCLNAVTVVEKDGL